ncbi:acetylxylan esterase [Sciscionella sediminilitoris]|uniref:acetylxylan esterase n=1 Tax=Sciscionella sediminilitoris TaxID=1445613 RepID=UPI0004DFA4CA|nr:acetylxylan esterase [Sciscionella sp. SE31]
MSFWAELDAELAGFPARPLVERYERMCTEHFTGYRVWFSGLDGHRLFGFLSVPAGEGPFPALLETPRHGSVNNPPHYNDRLRYVMFTMMHRGQRLADVPFAAAYPGLFTLGVSDPRTYVYRAIIADCLRGAEFLAAHPQADPARLAVSGEDLVLHTVARRPLFRAAVVNTPLLHDALHRREHGQSYPLEELNDLLRAHPERETAVRETFAVYEPATLARDIRAEVLLAAPAEGPGWNGELLAALGDRGTVYQRGAQDASDTRAIDAWLSGRLGMPGMARFAS